MPEGLFSAFKEPEKTLGKPGLPKPEEGAFAAFREAPRDKTDTSVYEARVFPVPKTKKQKRIQDIQLKVPWERIRDEVTVPLMNEAKKGTAAAKDSVNAFMHRVASPPEKLMDEALANYFRKLGK